MTNELDFTNKKIRVIQTSGYRYTGVCKQQSTDFILIRDDKDFAIRAITIASIATLEVLK